MKINPNGNYFWYWLPIVVLRIETKRVEGSTGNGGTVWK